MEQNVVVLYHATNKSNCEKMKRKGYIGITKRDYDNIAKEIIEFYNITDRKLKVRVYDHISSFNDRIDEPEYRNMLIDGCVSFFPSYAQCCLLKNAAINGGENLGLSVKNAIKSIARHKGIKYSELPDKDYILKKYCGIGTGFIILEMCIPIYLLYNFLDEEYLDGKEILSSKNVSMLYLNKVIYQC